ncbi:FkbM family methyltransferase [Nodosilinea sp. LEGE 06152]|uniref:FkbM family methyltransferase n=1 Tax=Nodosilinea sp. LEGE 06152 TaxID=2777966 RepID=UPI0018819B96|nr:FkbM family methyltransferase [Nodosilinea sp. LEGE 06152]MBE9158407.1 FkbM family methyltransferase [Nodosilinea sp. LEGE 06152]
MFLKTIPQNIDFQKLIKAIRPASLQSLLIRFIYGNLEKRRILVSDKETGLSHWVDPFSNLGSSLVSIGTYEQATQKILADSIHEGSICIDVGANEGYFTCLMAKLAGKTGTVLAIEPQFRLLPLIFENLNENLCFNATVFNFCLSDKPNEKLSINLWPETNTGASSVARHYRWGSKAQQIHAFNLDFLLENKNIEAVDFVKVDVEGYEYEVVCGMRKSLAMGKIKAVAIDYHKTILESRGIDPLDIHENFSQAGYISSDNQVIFDGYEIYRYRSSAPHLK